MDVGSGNWKRRQKGLAKHASHASKTSKGDSDSPGDIGKPTIASGGGDPASTPPGGLQAPGPAQPLGEQQTFCLGRESRRSGKYFVK